MTTSFRGVFSLLVTPLQVDGTINWRAYDAIVDHHLQAGVQGLFAVCGTSQMQHLSWEEQVELARRAARKSHVPVVATANSEPDITKHVTRVKEMADTGVDGLVLVPPPEPLHSDTEWFSYFELLIAAAQIPCILYEWPGRRPRFIPPHIYKQLVDMGVRGIKDTTCTLAGILAKIEVKGASTIFQAHAPLLLEAMHRGAEGIMAIFSAGCPQLAVRWWQALEEEQQDRLAHCDELVQELNDLAGLDHPRTSQYLLQLQGIPLEVMARGKEQPFGAQLAVEQWWEKVKGHLAI